MKVASFAEWLDSREERTQFENAVRDHDEETVAYFRDMYAEYVANTEAGLEG